MTLDEAYEYVDRALESESECRAEFGSGAVSLGYDPYEALALNYDGYRTSDDPTFTEARRIIDAYTADRALVRIERWAPSGMSWQSMPFGRWECVAYDGIPF